MEGFIVTKPENRFYLSGFSGTDGMLFITLDRLFLLTDPRYTEQAREESPGWEIIAVTRDYATTLKDISQGTNNIGFESRHLTYYFYLLLQKELGEQLKPRPGLVEELRRIKDSTELDRIRQAVQIGDIVFREILSSIVAGKSERDIAIEMERLLKVKGCSRAAFETIAVSGTRASLPHGQPSDKALEKGDMLTLDFGGFYAGYAGDTTRTVAIGVASSRLREVYRRVLEAQMAAIQQVRAGITGREVDAAARDCLKSHGLDTYFVHSTGHGLGLEVHEEPSLGARSEAILQENMVITIEPGVYIPGWGGVRIEDVVIVKGTGCEVLTTATKELLIL